MSISSATVSERRYYLYERVPFTRIPMTALYYNPTARIQSLAQPKIRRDTTIRDGKQVH